MKWYIKTIIILSVVIICLLIFMFLIFHFSKKRETELIKNNEKTLQQSEQFKKERDQSLKNIIELKNKVNNGKVITKEIIKTMTDPEKEKTILDQQIIIDKQKNIIDDDIIVINSLHKSLLDSNDELKSKKDKLNNITGFGLAGLDEKLNIDIYAGLLYSRTLYQNKYFSFDLGGGAAVKVYKNIGGALIFQIGFNF